MHRKFRRDLLICLVPVLVCAWLVVDAYFKYQAGRGGFKLGVDLAGGTILVYEIDPQLTRELSAGVKLADESEDMAKLAAALKRRIDPADIRNVTIRPVGKTRVEIVLPTGGATHSATNRKDFTQEEVEAIKALIRQVGSLEFRIVANDVDDKLALQAAENYFTEPANKKEIEERAQEGLPPNPPVGDFQAFGELATYSWVELGKEERITMRLDNAQATARAADEESSASLWARMAAAREAGTTLKQTIPSEGKVYSYLLYSRPVSPQNVRLSDEEKQKKRFEYFMLTRSSDSVKVGGNISISATVGSAPSLAPAVDFTFNGFGARRFYDVTFKNKPSGPDGSTVRQLAIMLDGMLVSAPTLNAAISDRGQITGNYTHKDAVQLVNILRSGALTAVLKPQPVSENTIGSTLGPDTIKSGTLAVGLAFLFVLAFMVFYYRFAGLVASVALLANLLLTIGFMVAVNATFTLPGLAGLVLMLGMAVDANVLIYERLREERDRGANLTQAIRNGYDRAFGTIIDTHLTSIFTAIVLYTVGNDQLKGFGVSLTAGLIISLFTSLFVTRLIFDYWIHRHWLHKLKMLRLFSRPSIDFMRYRKPIMAATVIVTVITLGLFLLRGEKGLNVDFIGGTAYGGQLSAKNPKTKDGISIGELRNRMDEERQKTLLAVAAVEPREDPSGQFKNLYVIRYTDGSEEQVSLNNPPLDGNATPEQMAENVKQRASAMPDWSVEQVYLSGSTGDRSRFFTVRTTEKEPELVQLAIDRLFRDDDPARTSLLARTVVKFEKSGTVWDLSFFNPDTGETEATSPSFVKTLLEREFRIAFGDALGTQEPFTLAGIGQEKDGRFEKMRLKLSKALEATPDAKVNEALSAATERFAKRPQPERLETFDSTLASEMRSRAFYAIITSWIAILLYLWFRFGSWTFGLAAVMCLIHDLCFTLGVIAVCHYIHDTAIGQLLGLKDFKIDLPAVAALLTLVGYSVNEIIVNFARIREVRGKNPELTPQTINNSVNQTLSRTILTSMTVALVSFVLYAFGGEGVHLFAFVMFTGVLVSTFSSIYVASPLLLILGEGKHHGHPHAPVAPQKEPATA